MVAKGLRVEKPLCGSKNIFSVLKSLRSRVTITRCSDSVPISSSYFMVAVKVLDDSQTITR